MLMPVAFQLARKNNIAVRYLLMPMAFAALLGGIVTLVGTSPNIIVARMREELVGEPFAMFDFTPVGAGLAIARRGLPRLRLAAAAARPQGRRLDGRGLQPRRLHHRGHAFRRARRSSARPSASSRSCREGEVEVLTLLRGARPRPRAAAEHQAAGRRHADPRGRAGRARAAGRTRRSSSSCATRTTGEIDAPDDDIGVMEAVVTADSPLVDRSATQDRLARAHHQVNLLAVSRSGRAHRASDALDRGSSPATSSCCRAI